MLILAHDGARQMDSFDERRKRMQQKADKVDSYKRSIAEDIRNCVNEKSDPSIEAICNGYTGEVRRRGYVLVSYTVEDQYIEIVSTVPTEPIRCRSSEEAYDHIADIVNKSPHGKS